jgi:DNA-binding NarL/FixJ family response regulator
MTRILVADDSEVVRRGIRRLLTEHKDWEVCGEAVDGQETVAKAEQLAPDVVVLDFAMPVMNGIEAARQILQARPRTGIVLCSMYLDDQLASVASDVGIHSLLSKDSVGTVIQGVEAALRGESFSESSKI